MKLVVYIPYDKRKGYKVADAYKAARAALGDEVDYRPIRLTKDAPVLPCARETAIQKPIVDNPPQSLFAAAIREWCRLDFLKTDADWLCFIDADCVVGEDFGKLLPEREEIVTALYCARGNPAGYLAFGMNGKIRRDVKRPDLLKHADEKRMEVGWSGMGATFIPRRALENISWADYRLSPWPQETGEDGYFCLKAAKLGIPTIVDWSVPVKHYADNGSAVWIDEELIGFMSKKKKSVGSDAATGVVYLGPSPIDHPEIHRVYPGVFKAVEDEEVRAKLVATGKFMAAVEETEPEEAGS